MQKEYDEKYVLVDYASAEKLFSREGLATSIEIRLKSGVSPREAKTLVQGIAGQGFTVMTGMEQHQTLYEVMENEKLIGYLVVTLVLLLSAVTVVGSLSMIVLEKTRDISIMRSYGATTSQILKVFLAVGFFIGMISSVSGCLLGFAIGTAQQKWGFVKLGAGENFIVENFPIHMNPSDFFWVFLTVFSLAMLAALYPAWKASSLRIVEGLRK